MAHGPQEVIRPAIADELEALLQVRRELLVVVERTQVLAESAVALEIEDRPGVVDDRGDLRSAADDSRVAGQRVDLAISHAGDAFHLKTAERRLDRGPLRVDDAPAYPRLEDALAELLKVVVDALRLDPRRSFHDGVTLNLFNW